jgi:hypothetical protein
MNQPLKALAFGEVHGLGESGGEVDVPLLAVLAVDTLNFYWEAHNINRSLHDWSLAASKSKPL